MDCSQPGSYVDVILQARMLEWVARFFSPGGLPDPEIEPEFPALTAGLFASKPTGKLEYCAYLLSVLNEITYLNIHSTSVHKL